MSTLESGVRSVKQRSFFATYPDEYDAMTSAAVRETNHAREVEALIAAFHPTRVLDAGCATGLTSRLFAERGVEAVGLDCVRPIVEVARRRYREAGLPVSFRTGRFEKLPKSLSNRFDLVVCLANAIVGVGDSAGLRRALEGFRRVLRPAGSLVIQLRNFTIVREGEFHPVKATSVDGRTYLRLMRRRGGRIELTTIRLDSASAPPSFETFSHEFPAFTAPDLQTALNRAGFVRIKRFGNLKLEAPFRASARDLVITARRPG